MCFHVHGFDSSFLLSLSSTPFIEVSVCLSIYLLRDILGYLQFWAIVIKQLHSSAGFPG